MTMARCTRASSDAASDRAMQYRSALPVLETTRLTLRAPVLEDFLLWARISAEPGSEYLDGPATPQDAWTGFCGSVACWHLHGHGPFTLIRRADGAGLGFVFLGYEWADEEPELGWLLAQEARGQGYGTEAATAVRDWGLGLVPSFVSCVRTANAPSNALARRLGAVIDREASARLGGNIWRHGSAPNAVTDLPRDHDEVGR
ncbi:MAG: GNAT family N-acetyltransferase [Pseudomonadota bacterium]